VLVDDGKVAACSEPPWRPQKARGSVRNTSRPCRWTRHLHAQAAAIDGRPPGQRRASRECVAMSGVLFAVSD
jgi:hypothetical protein